MGVVSTRFRTHGKSSCEVLVRAPCSTLASVPLRITYSAVVENITMRMCALSSLPKIALILAACRNLADHVSHMSANLLGTNILTPLEQILESKPKEGYPRQLFVLTDGEVHNTQECINFVRKHADTTRVFTFGIGNEASQDLVRGLPLHPEAILEFYRTNFGAGRIFRVLPARPVHGRESDAPAAALNEASTHGYKSDMEGRECSQHSAGTVPPPATVLRRSSGRVWRDGQGCT